MADGADLSDVAGAAVVAGASGAVDETAAARGLRCERGFRLRLRRAGEVGEPVLDELSRATGSRGAGSRAAGSAATGGGASEGVSGEDWEGLPSRRRKKLKRSTAAMRDSRNYVDLRGKRTSNLRRIIRLAGRALSRVSGATFCADTPHTANTSRSSGSRRLHALHPRVPTRPSPRRRDPPTRCGNSVPRAGSSTIADDRSIRRRTPQQPHAVHHPDRATTRLAHDRTSAPRSKAAVSEAPASDRETE